MILLSILIFFIGISRIYLGVHYASDVAGGFALASVYLILYIIVIERFVVGEKNEISEEL